MSCVIEGSSRVFGIILLLIIYLYILIYLLFINSNTTFNSSERVGYGIRIYLDKAIIANEVETLR